MSDNWGGCLFHSTKFVTPLRASRKAFVRIINMLNQSLSDMTLRDLLKGLSILAAVPYTIKPSTFLSQRDTQITAIVLQTLQYMAHSHACWHATCRLLLNKKFAVFDTVYTD